MIPSDFQALLDDLARPAAWGDRPGPIELRQTHISVVFLLRDEVFKLKKPLDLGFLDYTTLERRQHFCAEEVRLNRRLAPSVYHGVVPIARGPGGHRVGGPGEPVEYAVHMTRLPDAARLAELLARGTLDAALLEELARRLADFHRRAAGGAQVARQASFPRVESNLLENFAATRGQAGGIVSRAVQERVERLCRDALEGSRPLIEARAAAGRPRDGHGDLHLDHIYHLPGRRPPDDLPIVDCVEFAERFRWLDPAADIAFLVMDLGFRGRHDLARHLAGAWAAAADDAEGLALLPLYTAYRTLVRAKVDGLAAGESELAPEEREARAGAARAHWLFALDCLEPPRRRPALLLVGGLPGSGKSTLSAALGAALDFQPIVADRVRKELAGVAAGESAASDFATGLYSPGWNDRTYAECWRQAEALLREGGRVLIDASFREEARRAQFLARARALAVRTRLLLCTAGESEVRARLAARQGGPSDADFAVYLRLRAAWEPLAAPSAELAVTLPSDSREAVLRSARAALEEAGLG